jgi:membrane-bound lytic murein transglycosylase D
VRVETVAASGKTKGGVMRIGTHVPTGKNSARGAKTESVKVTRVAEPTTASSKKAAVKPAAVAPKKTAEKKKQKQQ